MKKKFLITACVAACTLTACQSTKNEKQISQKQPVQEEIVGGWYPIFFDKYDSKKTNSIIESITDNKVKRITITYDENKVLAEKIRAAIQAQINFAVMMEYVPTKDGSAKFNHSRVVVTVYQR
jgi:hypothetical protein